MAIDEAKSNSTLATYVPTGTVPYPGFVKHDVRSNVQRQNVGIVSSVMRPSIPGVDLHQTTQVNGVLIDTSR